MIKYTRKQYMAGDVDHIVFVRQNQQQNTLKILNNHIGAQQ